MPEDFPNPYRLTVFTNDPGEAITYEAKGWTMSDMLVMKFFPGMNDLMNPKLYALRFWRPVPPKQPNLL